MSCFISTRVYRVGLPLLVATLLWAGGARAAGVTPLQAPIWHANPDVAAFEKSENERLVSAQAIVDRVVAVRGPRTVENTLRGYDQAVSRLNSAAYFSALMEAVHPDAAFRDRATAVTRKVSAAQTDLSLNGAVYRALSAVDLSHADAPTRYYVQRQLLEFRLAGVDKDEVTRARLKKLFDSLTEAQSAFERNINDGTKKLTVSSAAELDGLPQDYIDAHRPDKDGAITLTTDYPDYIPAMTFAKSDDLRRRLASAFANRAYPANRDVLMTMVRVRYEIATLLGYDSWADYNSADKMIVNGAHIAAFIQEVDAAARPTAEREVAMMLAEKRRTDPGAAAISVHEKAYYQEQVRRSKYDFDSQSVRPYLAYPLVKQGILDTAATLFHVTFRQEKNVTSWDPSVESWLVFDDGKVIGRIYLDMHPRPGKYSHAEMSPVLDGIRGKQLPEAILICNFPAPSAADPGLMVYGDVETFFHEFGHLMHWILGGQRQWAGIGSITMEADFVEAPSQMLEEWMHSPQVLASFARDQRSGQPIPPELVARMNHADAFGRANWAMTQNSYTAISYELYRLMPQDVDPDTIEANAAARHTPFTVLPNTHPYASFGHLASYSSAYYTYLWDKVIAEDFFGEFDQNNLLAGDAPMRYRRTVLEPGGSLPANDLVKNFLGRPQTLVAFKRWLGTEFAAAPH